MNHDDTGYFAASIARLKDASYANTDGMLSNIMERCRLETSVSVPDINRNNQLYAKGIENHERIVNQFSLSPIQSVLRRFPDPELDIFRRR